MGAAHMGETRWALFEDQVRDIASKVYGKPCTKENISGTDFDGVIRIGKDQVVLVESTVRFDLAKVREDITRVMLARQYFLQQGIYCKPFIVLQREPADPGIALRHLRNDGDDDAAQRGLDEEVEHQA